MLASPDPLAPTSTTLPPTTSRRERRSAELRERLFRSALRLFAEKGFVETTVEDITEAADVGKGTFFNYFPSKDHILLVFADMQIAKLELAVAGLRESALPLPEFLKGLAVRMTEEPMKNPGITRTLLQAYLSTTLVREAMIARQDRAHQLHTQIVELGQQRGEIRDDIAAPEIAHTFRQTILGTLLVWSVAADGSLRERIDSAFHILWTGLAPRNSKLRPNVGTVADSRNGMT